MKKRMGNVRLLFPESFETLRFIPADEFEGIEIVFLSFSSFSEVRFTLISISSS